MMNKIFQKKGLIATLTKSGMPQTRAYTLRCLFTS